jgi:glycosyltransferase involved in cell wall biosynthesis
MTRQVVHLLGTAQPHGTGVARIVAATAAKLDPARYRVEAWFLGGSGPLAAEIERAGVTVRVIDWSNGARDPIGAWRFWRGLRQARPAIVHQHSGARAVSALTRAATDAALIIHVHGRILEARGQRPMPIVVPGADAVIAVSRAVAQHVQNTVARVIYTGVDVPERQHGGSPTGRLLGVAARLVPVKGVADVIRAVGQVRNRVPDVRLEIAGDGPERPALEECVRQLGLSDSVTFLGWQADLAPVFSRWDVVVQGSRDEGFPVALVEAMAAGLPVVATAVGGTVELVETGRTGWLVPPEDPEALASRLCGVLADGLQRRAMGVAARARVRECFSANRMAGEIEAIYDELLARKVGGRRLASR